MFGLFKRKPKYPFAKSEMMQPLDTPVNTTDAKKFYRDYAKHTGFLEKDEISYHVDFLAEEIRNHTEMLKETFDDKKEDVADIKREISALKKKLKSKKAEKDESYRDDIEAEIEDLEGHLESLMDDLNAAKQELTNFKTDKREFIIDYINTEIHGSDWRSKI